MSGVKRIVLAVLLALCIWSVKATLDSRARERAEAEARAEAELDIADLVAAQVSGEDPASLAAAEAGGGAEGAEGEAVVEEETDPVVHCVVGDEGTFVRESDCLSGGGVVDEPSWAQLD